MLNLALHNPSFFQPNANQGSLRQEMVELMKKDPVLSKFYKANEKKILANMAWNDKSKLNIYRIILSIVSYIIICNIF